MSTLTDEEFLAVFDHCPNVRNLRVPPASISATEEDLDSIARSISERCPHLRRLSSKHTNTSFVTAIMEAMSNQQQIEEVKVVYNHGRIGIGTVRRAFSRHSTTLCKVDFRYAFHKSKDLMAILELCESLEILIQFPDYCGRPFITLADAISVPWACKRIRHLELSIGLECVALTSADLPYYQRPAPVTLSEEEKRQFSDLEMFYREIGSLVNVEYLDLRGTYMNDEGDRMNELNEELDAFTFPGMLAIRDDETGRPGYLDMLSGLVKLKELHGTVRATTDEAIATVGYREMEWIASHWPALERVAFFASDQVVKAPFRQLRDALRPGLSLSQFNLVDQDLMLLLALPSSSPIEVSHLESTCMPDPVMFWSRARKDENETARGGVVAQSSHDGVGEEQDEGEDKRDLEYDVELYEEVDGGWDSTEDD
ncbi:MAG: hypothetical protein J3R72DRAFT_524304 [Linnemannia gamsii]|nr:MAG: hypothetical protein J3R72DRAFT_524304 [Linnemannia gamsii]